MQGKEQHRATSTLLLVLWVLGGGGPILGSSLEGILVGEGWVGLFDFGELSLHKDVVGGGVALFLWLYT